MTAQQTMRSDDDYHVRRHTVADHDSWREAYEGFAPTLKAFGVIASTVYQSVDNPNDITVAHGFATLDAAQAFANSDELRTARPGAGVASEPTVWFVKEVQEV